MPEQAPALNRGIDNPSSLLAGEFTRPFFIYPHNHAQYHDAMVLAYHLILSCYGFWLPNDPRGSWSTEVRRYELLRFGPATKVTTHRSVAGIKHDYALRQAAKAALKYPPVTLNGLQARATARGFAEVCEGNSYQVYACVVMPDHAHLVIPRHQTHTVEQITRRLKAKATQTLNNEGLDFGHTPWAQGEWKVYLNTPRDIRRVMRYVQDNPVKAGHKRQQWKFVTPYDGG